MTQYEKYWEIHHWVAKQYSKDTIEILEDLIDLLRPTKKIIETIHQIVKQEPTEQEFLDRLQAVFPQAKI